MRTLVPFLMFCGAQQGKAGEAIEWYCSIFEDSRVIKMDRYRAGDTDPEGTVRHAIFELGGHQIMAIDSAAPHDFTFTPAISLWVDCSSDAEIERLASRLGDGGRVLMPLAKYDFSERFAWIADRYGVTWQLNLAGPA